jgi:hypothetical protein
MNSQSPPNAFINLQAIYNQMTDVDEDDWDDRTLSENYPDTTRNFVFVNSPEDAAYMIREDPKMLEPELINLINLSKEQVELIRESAKVDPILVPLRWYDGINGTLLFDEDGHVKKKFSRKPGAKLEGLYVLFFSESEEDLDLWKPDPIQIQEIPSIEVTTRTPISVYDMINLEETPLQRYLHNKPNDFVFLVSESRAFSVQRSQIQKIFEEEEYYYSCDEESQRSFPLPDQVDLQNPYIRLSVGPIQAYIAAGTVFSLLNENENRLFAVQESDNILPFTVAIDSIDATGTYQNYRNQDIGGVGADHCQGGSDKRIFDLFRVKNKMPSLEQSPTKSFSTPEDVKQKRAARQSITMRMNEARQKGDRQTMISLARELQKLI